MTPSSKRQLRLTSIGKSATLAKGHVNRPAGPVCTEIKPIPKTKANGTSRTELDLVVSNVQLSTFSCIPKRVLLFSL